MKRVLVILIVVSLGFCSSESNDQYLYYESRLSLLIDSLNLSGKDISIYIDKSDYVLTIKHKGISIKQYSVVLGTNPVDDKLMEGDRSTPEGVFKVRGLYLHASWDKFIWIDYPTKYSWISRRFNRL